MSDHATISPQHPAGEFHPPAPTIEHAADPRQPGRLFYRITGATREAVQSVMTDLTNKVDGGWGYAVFDGPHRCDGGYVAQGAVVVYEAAATEAVR